MRPSRSIRLVVAAFLLAATPAFAFAQDSGPCCVLADNGGGSAALPPNCPIGYNGGGQVYNGLPAGSPLLVTAKLHSFFNVVPTPGGSLGGEIQQWNGTLTVTLTGTGIFSSYLRTIALPMTGSTESAPRMPFAPVQSFATDLYTMQGQITGDPDFDLLRITGGNGFGLPSPGWTILTSTGGGWAVDSFFDITYRVDFIGKAGGPFGGYSGSSTNSLEHFTMCHEDPTPARPASWGAMKALYR